MTPAGEALALSLALYPYADWKVPQFLGMAVAIAVAEALDLSLQWPNDLVIDGPAGLRKVGGVLSEMVSSVPIVEVGINLTVTRFPAELERIATSLLLAGRPAVRPEEAQLRILRALETVPEPTEWAALSERWMVRDQTPGKRYVFDGTEREAVGIDEQGQLLLMTDQGVLAVPSAEAWYGDDSPSD